MEHQKNAAFKKRHFITVVALYDCYRSDKTWETYVTSGTRKEIAQYLNCEVSELSRKFYKLYKYDEIKNVDFTKKI